MKRGRHLVTLLLLVAVLSAGTAQATVVVVNSQDWIDVYSAMLYARLNGYPSIFLTTKRSITILPQILDDKDDLLIFESERVPYTVNVARKVRRDGFKSKTVYSRTGFGLNVRLAEELGVTRFIVVDPTYGFNAISVAPYAVITRSFVLFADAHNIDQIAGFLGTRPSVDHVLIYGQVAEEVLQKLGRFSPEIIDTGHRYKDNVEILKRYFQFNPQVDQALLTSGEFLEAQMIGGEPIILIGRERVLDETIEFARNANMKTMMLIGNELISAGKQLKDATGKPVFAKVGLGIPTGTAEYEPIKALDMFFLPKLFIQLDFRFVQYNILEQVVEIVYKNSGSRVFLSGTINILVDGEVIQAVGDKGMQRMEANETSGFRYPIDLGQYFAENRNVTAQIFTIYGESPEIIDRAIEIEMRITTSAADDDCELELGKVTFDERTQRISVNLKNPSDVDCYASVNLLDLIIDDEPKTVAGSEFITAGSTKVVKIKQRMNSVDLADNPTVHVRIRYGEQEGLLFKIIDKRVPLTQEGEYTRFIIGGVIAVLLILIIILFVLWRRSKKEKHDEIEEKPKRRRRKASEA